MNQNLNLCHILPRRCLVFAWVDAVIPALLHDVNHRLHRDVELWRPADFQASWGQLEERQLIPGLQRNTWKTDLFTLMQLLLYLYIRGMYSMRAALRLYTPIFGRSHSIMFLLSSCMLVLFSHFQDRRDLLTWRHTSTLYLLLKCSL